MPAWTMPEQNNTVIDAAISCPIKNFILFCINVPSFFALILVITGLAPT
jgi:hypothetical protein